jgi:autotransporter-associated beta strand protein
MIFSLNIAIFNSLGPITRRRPLKKIQGSEQLRCVLHVSRLPGMFFLKPQIYARYWFFLFSFAILGSIHLSAAAACLSPDPYSVSSDTSINLVQSTGCTLGSFTVGAGITLSEGIGAPVATIINDGTVTLITNNGTISGNNKAIFNRHQPSTLTTINNVGTILSSSQGIANEGTITLLNNSGTINAHTGVLNHGTITTLTNTGNIMQQQGVYNFGVIGTLNNQQGAMTNVLTYISSLPQRYNIIIASTIDYGKLLALNSAGTTTFGISSLSAGSSIVSGTAYANVLSGVSSAQLGLGGAMTFSGISNGYSYTLNETTSGIWSLTVTAFSSGGSGGGSGTVLDIIPNINSGFSYGLSNLGVTANPVLAGGTLVLNNGDASSASIAITSAGGTIQQTTSGSATLSGVFSGAGSLTFTGKGTTIVSGLNTYGGGTTVSGGTLLVSGPSPTGTGDVFVASAGTLMGTGTIAGNSIVSGVLKPGNSPGYLSFTQNLTLNAGSTYQQDIAGAAQASSATHVGASGYYSFVSVGSQLTITSGATLTPRLSNLFSASEVGYGSSIYVPVLGDKFRIITATGGITGRFTTLTQPAELSSGTQMIALYNVNNGNSIDLAIAPTSYSSTLSLSTTNAKSVASVLDQLLGVNKAGTASAVQDSLLYAVAGQNAASLPGFARSLAGEVHAASVATLSQTTQRVQQSVLARLGDYPMAPSQLNPALNNALLTGGISATNTSGLPTASMSTNPAVNPNAVNVTSAAVKDGRAWGEIAYQRSERASNSGGNGYNSNLYQIVTGVDAYSNAELGLKLGGGIALSNTTVSANGGNSTIQQGSLFVYGKMSVLQDYVLDGMASVGLSSTNLSRNDPTGVTGGFSSKAVLGNDALVSVGLSRAFEYNDLRVTPYARLTYQYVGQSSYDEGSGAAALNIARFSGSALRGVIGVAAGSLNKDPLKDDYTYRANIAVGADTSGLLNPTLNTTLGGYSSTVTTATAGSAFVQVGLYGTVKISDNAYAYAGVSGEARSGQTLYGGSVGLRIAF